MSEKPSKKNRSAMPHVHVLGKAKRVCLCCNKTFVSTGPANRICGKCKKGSSVLSRAEDCCRVQRAEY